MSKLIPVILLIILLAFGVFVLKNKTNVSRYTPEYELITIGKDSLVIFNYGTDIEIVKLSN